MATAPPRRPSRAASERLIAGIAIGLLAAFALSHFQMLQHGPHGSSIHLERPDWAPRTRAAARQEGSEQPTPAAAVELWAGHRPPELAAQQAAVRQLLTDRDVKQLEDLCGRCLLHQFKLFVGFDNAHKVFVATGDIGEMWIRDSAVQLGILLPRMEARPSLRVLVEGAVRTQAFFTVMDPYANAYNLRWRNMSTWNKDERNLGRGGWVGTRNFELDSGAYFLHLLWNLHAQPGYRRDALLEEPVVYEAASLMVDTWTTELQHEQESSFRYSELPRAGLGTATNYTGMVWSGFRPSDEPTTYGFNVPANMYAHSALERAMDLNAAVWRSASFEKRARHLMQAIKQGIEQWGIVERDGERLYAFEVDGLGNALVDYDDANVPSLLSIPLLGYAYDKRIYAATRQRLLSSKNPFYFKGQHLAGIGSSHTKANYVWPMALIVQALTAEGPEERVELLKMLLKTQCGNGLMHESVHVDNLDQCSRSWFGWANALLVTLVEAAMGGDCDAAAERIRRAAILERENSDRSQLPKNGSPEDALYYETIESTVLFDTHSLHIPAYIARRQLFASFGTGRGTSSGGGGSSIWSGSRVTAAAAAGAAAARVDTL